MAFKFIHAADLHIDSPMVGLEAYEGAPVEGLRLVSGKMSVGVWMKLI